MSLNSRIFIFSHIWWLNVPLAILFMVWMLVSPSTAIYITLIYLATALGLNHFLEVQRYLIARERIELDHVIIFNRAKEQIEQEMLEEEFANQGEESEDEENLL